jgi:hypothetical protein
VAVARRGCGGGWRDRRHHPRCGPPVDPLRVAREQHSLTVPSLSLAGLLTMWANEAGIAFAHNHAPPGRRNGGPTIFTFATVDDLDRFVATADMKIAALEVAAHRRRPKVSASVPLGAALRVAFRAISRGSG